jgi:phosphoribosyl-ATP pyrophosphohydrolase
MTDDESTTEPAATDRAADADALLAELFAVIEDRKATRPADSHTADLLRAGEAAAAEKVGEEAAELLVAATSASDDEVAHEAADVVYHLLVLLAARDLTLDDLRAELADRRP